MDLCCCCEIFRWFTLGFGQNIVFQPLFSNYFTFLVTNLKASVLRIIQLNYAKAFPSLLSISKTFRTIKNLKMAMTCPARQSTWKYKLFLRKQSEPMINGRILTQVKVFIYKVCDTAIGFLWEITSHCIPRSASKNVLNTATSEFCTMCKLCFTNKLTLTH